MIAAWTPQRDLIIRPITGGSAQPGGASRLRIQRFTVSSGRQNRTGLIAQLGLHLWLRRINHVARASIRRGAVFSYRRKIRAMLRPNPHLLAPLDRTVESRHADYWRSLEKRVDPSWLRLFSHVSGIADPRYVPQDVYFKAIERRLNDLNYAWFYADKNAYERLFDPNLFVVTKLRNMAGTYLDESYRAMTQDEFTKRFNNLPEDCVIKLSIGSGGGRRIERLTRCEEGFRAIDGTPFRFEDLRQRYRRNFVVQPVIRQHPILAQFNPESVNTLRVMTYRSVKDEKVVPVKAALRTGRKSMVIDNHGRGGLACLVQPNGTLNDYATTKTGEKHTIHPDSGVPFGGVEIPGYSAVMEVVTDVAADVPPLRLLSFDVAVNESGRPLIIEINTKNVEINFLQTAGGPLFGDRTDEIRDWCAAHSHHDVFNAVRIR